LSLIVDDTLAEISKEISLVVDYFIHAQGQTPRQPLWQDEIYGKKHQLLEARLTKTEKAFRHRIIIFLYRAKVSSHGSWADDIES
jgi:hypothetical protein